MQMLEFENRGHRWNTKLGGARILLKDKSGPDEKYFIGNVNSPLFIQTQPTLDSIYIRKLFRFIATLAKFGQRPSKLF